MRDVLNGQITHRDKSLTGFSIYCQWQLCAIGNSICLRLDMLLHSSPKARYVKSEEGFIAYRFAVLLNIFRKTRIYRVRVAGVPRSEEWALGVRSVARTYRSHLSWTYFAKVNISTKEKREQEYKEKILIFLLSFCLYRVLHLREATIVTHPHAPQGYRIADISHAIAYISNPARDLYRGAVPSCHGAR